MQIDSVGIIGAGRFGGHFGKQLNKHDIETIFHDPDVFAGEDTKSYKDEELKNLHRVYACPLVVYAVPMRAFQKAFTSTAHHVARHRSHAEGIIIDVCTLKSFAGDIMSRHTPHFWNPIGTHPLFGPQSAPLSIEGQRIAVCQLRRESSRDSREFDDFVDNFLAGVLGLNVIRCTPQEHDEAVAYSQLIDHVVGRAAVKAGVVRTKFATATHDKFMDIVDIVGGNSMELFEDMNRFNPFAKKARKRFLKALTELDATLSKLK